MVISPCAAWKRPTRKDSKAAKTSVAVEVRPSNWGARARDKKDRHRAQVRVSNSVLHRGSSKNHNKGNSSNVLLRVSNRTAPLFRVNSAHPSQDREVGSSARVSSSVLQVSNNLRARVVVTSKKAVATHPGYRKKIRIRAQEVEFRVV